MARQRPESNQNGVGTKDFRQQRAQDFKDQKIQSAKDFNFNQYDPGKKGNPEGGTHISGAEVRHLRNNNKKSEGGGGLRDSVAALQAQKDGGATFGKQAQAQFDRMSARVDRMDSRKAAKQKAKAAGSTGKETNAIDDTQTGENDAVPSNISVVDNTQTQQVTQDNDINTTVAGNNNTVVNNQDNSVRQYGGDNRSFTYNGGGEGSGSPVSAATISGYYDVDDSPAAQAKFQDMYKDFNKDNSNRFAGQAMETLAMFGKHDARDYTPESMENALNRSTQYSFDRADRQTGHVFGDIWNDNYITESWKMPTPAKPIESNAEEIADKAKEDIENID